MRPNCSFPGPPPPFPGLPSSYVRSLEFLGPAITLVLFNVVVIGGNSLVIIAVFTSKKLRGVTNTYIVSLAFSDLLLGMFVLPFSSANEVLRYWPFGELWCSMWLAVDVWLSTASILNLCAISFDRYLAVTKPFRYPALMSPVRARVLVALVWFVSFVVCFPPLIGWNEKGELIADKLDGDDDVNVTIAASLVKSRHPQYYNYLGINETLGGRVMVDCDPGPPSPPPQCVLTSTPGYIVYSACGSFWIPVWIMVFFYWRIYRTAVRTTSAINRGVLTTKAKKLSSASEHAVTLRIHRGGSTRPSTRPTVTLSTPPSNTDRLLSPDTGSSSRRSNSMRKASNSTSRLSIPDEDFACKQIRNSNSHSHHRNGMFSSKKEPKVRITFKKKPCKFTLLGAEDRNASDRNANNTGGHKCNGLDRDRRSFRRSMNGESYNGSTVIEDDAEETSFVAEDPVSDPCNSGNLKRGGRMNIKTHLKRINKEKKAAKTVGIIVGGFIACWAPFFSVYLLGAFCADCTPPMVFTIFFWLGYCNSAINPFVYALFSKDFRYAFKKLLRCRCERRVSHIRDRKGSKFFAILNSLKVQISSKESNSNSE